MRSIKVKTPGHIYFIMERKIFKYRKEQFELWKDLSNTTFITGMSGRSEDDFFSNSIDGIGHYNGKDFQTIFKTDADITGRWIF